MNSNLPIRAVYIFDFIKTRVIEFVSDFLIIFIVLSELIACSQVSAREILVETQRTPTECKTVS